MLALVMMRGIRMNNLNMIGVMKHTIVVVIALNILSSSMWRILMMLKITIGQ